MSTTSPYLRMIQRDECVVWCEKEGGGAILGENSDHVSFGELVRQASDVDVRRVLVLSQYSPQLGIPQNEGERRT